MGIGCDRLEGGIAVGAFLPQDKADDDYFSSSEEEEEELEKSRKCLAVVQLCFLDFYQKTNIGQ